MHTEIQQTTIRVATPDDLDSIVALLPRLADFKLPAGRNADDLWSGDRALVMAWADGHRPDVGCYVATDHSEHPEQITGVAVVSLKPEMLSGKPSSHLEVLAVAKTAEGTGLGARLLQTAEQYAIDNDAESMTLHVFNVNKKARRLYEKAGFDDELIRYSKPLHR